MASPGILVHPSATTSLSRGWKHLVVSRCAVARHRSPIGSRNGASPMTASPCVRSHNRVHRVTLEYTLHSCSLERKTRGKAGGRVSRKRSPIRKGRKGRKRASERESHGIEEEEILLSPERARGDRGEADGRDRRICCCREMWRLEM